MDLSIYLIASMNDGLKKIEEALASGVTILQLREKDISSRLYLEYALKLRELTSYYHIPFMINDRVDIAMLCKADGVHLGQSDLPVDRVREMAGRDFIIGATAKTVETALQAEERGADYIGSGAWFATTTKRDATLIDREEFKKIKELVKIPVVAIGGINETNCHMPIQYKANGVAVSYGILGEAEPGEAVKKMKMNIKSVCVN